ncbi:MAG: hypothetical protein ACN6NV_14985, partial [Acinetobacter gandensis]|uniref:hypothetical protein n=1 Tax=Acinetobacter gandensis TaxID=1443941 RepID=UPI003CFFF90B
CVQASSFENYIAEKPFTDRFVQQSRLYLKKYISTDNIILFQLLASSYLLIITIIQIYCYLIILLPTTFIENQINIFKHKKDLMDKFSPDED